MQPVVSWISIISVLLLRSLADFFKVRNVDVTAKYRRRSQTDYVLSVFGLDGWASLDFSQLEVVVKRDFF